jgi:hypothetical protein
VLRCIHQQPVVCVHTSSAAGSCSCVQSADVLSVLVLASNCNCMFFPVPPQLQCILFLYAAHAVVRCDAHFS